MSGYKTIGIISSLVFDNNNYGIEIDFDPKNKVEFETGTDKSEIFGVSIGSGVT